MKKTHRNVFIVPASLLILFASPFSLASDGDGIPIGAVGMLLCAALVLFMQAGFALLESGMVRAKNSINVIMKNYTDLCVGVIAYWAIGFGLMFGVNSTGYLGFSHFFPSELSNTETIKLCYQIMFAATAATIVSGAVAERMRYWPYALISIFITAIIYPVYGSWAWGNNGWLAEIGFIDLAGSSVVHSLGGWCALAAVIVIGPRTGRYSKDGSVREIPGHNLPYVALGGFILWLGWFGFNMGSAASIDNIGTIIINTQLAGAAGGIGALCIMVATKKPVLMTNTINGVLGGLVASCAGASILEPSYALLTGVVAGGLSVIGSHMLMSMKVDDVVGAVSVHGICGSWGTLAAGLFYAGDMFDMSRVTIQILGIFVVFIWGFGATFILLKSINKFIPLRASKLHEQRGLDFSEHYEVGYVEFQGSVTHQNKSTEIHRTTAI